MAGLFNCLTVDEFAAWTIDEMVISDIGDCSVTPSTGVINQIDDGATINYGSIVVIESRLMEVYDGRAFHPDLTELNARLSARLNTPRYFSGDADG